MTPFELTAEAAPEYLASRGRPVSPKAMCRELGGGVSNTVVLVEDGDFRFILKQALPQLRTADEWLADRSRILRERDGLLAADRLLLKGWVPRVLWSDDKSYLYAMEAFAGDARAWKEDLLRGVVDAARARRAGLALSLTIRGSHGSAEIQRRFADQTAFDQLRTDPYYGMIARRHPAVAEPVEEWVACSRARRVALVHGDWSPKNMLVDDERMIFIDYECAHWGDPTFDAAFLTNHFLLKAFHRPQQASDYLRLASTAFAWSQSVLPPGIVRWFEAATARHLAFLLLARIDGKSPVEYLTDEAVRDRVRRLALRLIDERSESLDDCLHAVERSLQ